MAASIIVRFGGNLDELKKALSEGKVIIQQSSESMDKLASKLRGDRAITDAQRWAGALNQVGDATKLTAKEAERANAVFLKGIDAYKRAGREIPPELQKVQRETQAVVDKNRLLEESARKSADALKTQADSLQTLGRGMSSIGRGLTVGLTAPIVGIGAAAFQASSQVQAGLNRIREMTGKTGAEFQDLKRVFESVYANAPQAAEEVGLAIGQIATRTGRTGQALDDLSRQILQLADISHGELAPMIAATTRLFGDWSIATEEQSGALDYLWRTAQATGIHVQRLTELVVQFGAPMRTLGFNLNEAAALLGKWEKEGVNVETVLSGLRFALGKFAAAGVPPAEALKEITRRIKEAKNEGDAIALSFQIFGRRAAVDMARAVLEGRLDIDQLVTSLKAGTTTIKETHEETETFADRMAELKHQVDLALAPLGTDLKKAFEDLKPLVVETAKATAALVKAFSEMPAPVQKMVIGVAGGLALLGPLLIGAGSITTGLASLLLILDKLKAARVGTAAAEGVADIGTAASKALPWVTRLGMALSGLTIAGTAALALRGLAGSWAGAFEDVVRFLRGQAPINIPAHLTGLDLPLPKKELKVDIELQPGAPAFGPQLPPGWKAGKPGGGLTADQLARAIGAAAPPGEEGEEGEEGDLLARLTGKKKGGETPAQKVAKEVQALAALWASAKAQGADLGRLIDEKGKAFIDAAFQAQIWGVAVSDAFKDALGAAQQAALGKQLAAFGKDLAAWITESRKTFAAGAKDAADALAEGLLQNATVAQEFQRKLADATMNAGDLRMAQIEREREATLASLDKQAAGYDAARDKVNAYYDHMADVAAGTADTIVERMRAAGIATRDELQRTADEAERDYRQMADAVDAFTGEAVYSAEQVHDAWLRWYEADKRAKDEQRGWLTGLSALTDAFVELAQVGGESLAALARGFGMLQASMKLVSDALDQIQLGQAEWAEGFKRQGAVNIASGVMGLVGSGISAAGQIGTSKTGTAMGIGQMALTGAAIGSIIPGIGTAIGAGIGALVGGVTALFKAFGDRTKKDITRKMGEWGVEISEDLTKKITDDVKKLGGEVEASLYNLGAIIQEAGGVTATNFATLVGKLHDVFSMVGTGKFDTTKARKVIDESFGQFLAYATEAAKKTGGILDARLREIVRLDKVFKTDSKAITEFVQQQLMGSLGGLTQYLQISTTASDALAAQRTELKDLEKQLAQATTADQRAELQKRIDDLRKSVTAQEALVKGATLTSQTAAEGMGAALAGMFADLTARGTPLTDLLAQMEPAITALEKQLAATGFSGGEAFDGLRAKLGLMKDQTVGPLLQGFQGLGQGLAGLFNADILTPAMWQGLAAQMGATWQQMGDKGKDALALMQPQLQTLWEVWKETGWAVDDTTRAMLEEAEAQGLVGEKHKSANKQMIDGLNRIGDGIEALVKGFRFALPESMRPTRDGIGRIGRDLGEIVPPDVTPEIDTDATAAAVQDVQDQLNSLEAPTVEVRVTGPGGEEWEPGGGGGRGGGREMHRGGILPGSWPALVPRAHGGLAPDEYPIILQSGEAVLSRVGLATLGAAAVTAANAGIRGPLPPLPPGVPPIEPYPIPGPHELPLPVVNLYHIDAMDSQDVQMFFDRKGVKAWTGSVKNNANHLAPELKAVLRALLEL